jgi:hypothetical protein
MQHCNTLSSMAARRAANRRSSNFPPVKTPRSPATRPLIIQQTSMWASTRIRGHGWVLSAPARDAIQRCSSWGFRAISFVNNSLASGNGCGRSSREKGVAGGRGVPIVSPRAPPRPGLRYQLGPAKNSVGRDGRMMQACSNETTADECTEIHCPWSTTKL